jgi:RHS repeat-associated protein
VRQKFTSYERDNETDLDFAQARYYNYSHGRFTSIDPLRESAKAENPQTWNRYSYSYNNPLRFTDPSGMIAGDFYDREGYYLGTDGENDGKIYLLNERKRAVTENKEVNWRGTLKKEHADALKRDSTEVGGLIILERQEQGKDYTAGAFWTVGGGEKNVDGYMLEPAGPDTTERNQDKRVPEGVYNLHEHNGTAFKDTFGISNEKVPKDRAIVFHQGNTGRNTEGCIMPGGTIRNGVIEGGTSKPKLEKLKTFIKSEGASNVKLIIRNRIRN